MTANDLKNTTTKPAFFSADQLAEIAKAIDEIRQQSGNGEIIIGIRRNEVGYINCTKFKSFNREGAHG
jgi:hypothetical protein